MIGSSPRSPSELPFRLVQTCSQRAATILLALAFTVILGIAVASLIFLFEAVSAPAARTLLVQHPALGLEILAAIVFWLYLTALPVRRLIYRMTSARTVEMDPDTVTVNERGPLRTLTWSAPLASYAGLAHHLRASLSGTRHELILVHPEKNKSVLLAVAASLPQSEVDRVAELLGQPEVSTGALYRYAMPTIRYARPTWRHTATLPPLVVRT